jgi:hypothetical protein
VRASVCIVSAPWPPTRPTIPPVLARYAREMLARYAERMGADPALIDLAAGVAPDAVRYLIPAELRNYRVLSPEGKQ